MSVRQLIFIFLVYEGILAPLMFYNLTMTYGFRNVNLFASLIDPSKYFIRFIPIESYSNVIFSTINNEMVQVRFNSSGSFWSIRFGYAFFLLGGKHVGHRTLPIGGNAF